MAKRKPEEPPKGSPAWMATFSDLMNLLLCFFVLLFSMSTVDAEKFEMVIASLQSSMSILPAGGTSIGDGDLIAAGVSQLEFLDSYYNDLANSKAPEENDSDGESTVESAYKAEGLAESEKMAEEILENGSYKGIAKSRYVNDKQITDHYAIIPTGQGFGSLNGLHPTSAKVYEIIVRRFLSIFYPAAIYQKIGLCVKIKEEAFFSSFKVLAQPGYLKVAANSFAT